MSNEMTLFKDNKGSVIASDKLKKLKDINKRLGGAYDSIRRISFRGGRFREIVAGEQVNVSKEDSMNIVILDAAPVGRTYYEGAYSQDNPTAPTCWSADGKVPSPDVPEDDVMSRTCAECPMNVKGSGQGDTRACRYSQRLAIAIENKYDTVYQIQLAATSVFGDVENGNMPMQAYARFLSAHNTPAIAIVTEMYFDEDSETPKLFFKPVRPLEEDELDEVLELAEHPDVEKAITFTVFQSDEKGKAEKAAEDDDDDEEEKPAPKRRRKVVDDEDDEPAPKRRRKVVDDEDDEPAPKRRRKVVDDEDDDEEEEEKPAPKRRGRPAKKAVEDDEEPAPKRRGRPAKKAVEDDEEEEKPAPKRRRKVVDDEDDEEIEEPKVRRSADKAEKPKSREPVDLSSLVDEWDDEDDDD